LVADEPPPSPSVTLEKMVWARHCEGHSQRAIASELNIGRGKVKQIIDRDAAA
jgi:DNA-binding transcriptional regulator LsrR (DeoR family)